MPLFRICRRAELSRHKSGLTRTETLVLLGVFLLLVAVTMGPLLGYLKKVSVSRAVESAHTLNTLLSQYATDNNGVYPAGEGTAAAGKSEGIALNLLQNNYTPNATVFAVGSTATYSGSAADYSDLQAANVSWDFTGGATPLTGITTAAPDLLPIVYTTGEAVTYTPGGTGLDLPLSGAGPFGKKGMVVAYKSGNALFIAGVPTGTVVFSRGFISKDFKDTASYSQIKP